MPKPYLREVRDDVVRVVRAREDGVSMKTIATGFGASDTCLQNWLCQVDIEDGAQPGATRAEPDEARELRKRVRLLEHENEVLRRAAAHFAQAHLPGVNLGGILAPYRRLKTDPSG